MIWLIGTGPMAVDYFNVLDSLNCEICVIGRSELSADSFKDKTGHAAISGGLEAYLKTNPSLPDAAIVSVNVECLASVCSLLLDYGIKKILLEKPGGLDHSELSDLDHKSVSKNAEVLIAYNRRQYSSVRTAKKMIAEDGGVISFNFEITEWSHVIQNHKKDPRMMRRWFLGNTSHVIDTAFYLGGKPERLQAFSQGGVSWHPDSSIFTGAGISKCGALFSYNGNWEGPGRWALEVISKKRKYIFRPMEQLHVQEIGSIKETQIVPEDAAFDDQFKPGLFVQTKSFIEGNTESFCTLKEQVGMSFIYEEMAGY